MILEANSYNTYSYSCNGLQVAQSLGGVMTEKQATIIFNPMSGRTGRRADDVRHMVEILASRGINASSSATTGPGTATQQAAAAVAAGVDIITSYGGDG